MKPFQWTVMVALMLSILLNIALVTRKGGPRRERVKVHATDSGGGTGAVPAPAAKPGIAGAVSKETIAELRRGGVDEEIVTCLALAAGHLAYRERVAEIYYPDDRPFWLQGRANGAEVRPIEMERDRMVEELLGHGTRATIDLVAMERAVRFEGVQEQKIAAVEQLEADYRKVREMKGGSGWTEQEKLILKEFETDLARVLDPSELRAYQLRNSPSAIELAHDLGEAPVTEEEFGRLWEIKQSVERGAGGMARAELFGRYREVLPPEKFRAVLATALPGFTALTAGVAGTAADGWLDAWEILQSDPGAFTEGMLQPATREALLHRFGATAVERYAASAKVGRRR